jgi:hypothetical protein
MKQFMQIAKIMVLLTSFIQACAPLKRAHLEPEATNNTTLQKIIYYASLAGSSHNSQPWKLIVDDAHHLRLFADTTRALEVVDPNYRELYISLGAFLENLELAAKAYGYQARISIPSELNTKKAVATISLESTLSVSKQQRDSIIKILEGRCTLRGKYATKSIKNDDRHYLLKDTRAAQIFTNSEEPFNYIGEQTLKSYKQQNLKDTVQQELALWVRFSNKSVRKHRDGLTTAGMGITGLPGRVVQLFFTPKTVKGKTFVDKGIEKTAEQVVHCGGWLVISSKQNTPADWIHVGRQYERIHLRCRQLGIGMHPMNQIIEEQNFKEAVETKLSGKEHVQFIARLGYVNHYPEPVSVRRSVSAFCQGTF